MNLKRYLLDLVEYLITLYHEGLTLYNIIGLITFSIYIKYFVTRANTFITHKYDVFNRTVRSHTFWKFFYRCVSIIYPQSKDMLFMNWGYDYNIDDNKLYELDKYKQNMYYQTIDGELDNINVKNVLEVGCGNGGGITMLSHKYKNIHFTGVDLNYNSITQIKKQNIPNLLAFVDNAELLTTCNDNYYDVVLNVESSHCYNNVTNFYQQVYNKLKKKGIFIYTDYSTTTSWELIENDIISKGFKILKKRDVTANVCSASRKMSIYYENDFKYVRFLPLFNHIFKNFSNNPNSNSYKRMMSGKYKYMTYKFEKYKF